VRQTDEVLLF